MSNRFTEKFDTFDLPWFIASDFPEIFNQLPRAAFHLAYWNDLQTGVEVGEESHKPLKDSNAALFACFLAEIDDETMAAFLEEYFHASN